MGPTCEIILPDENASTLEAIDAVLASLSDRIERTRKGAVWSVRVRGRPVDVSVAGSPAVVTIAAGCNDDIDYAVLREISAAIVHAVGGEATRPEK